MSVDMRIINPTDTVFYRSKTTTHLFVLTLTHLHYLPSLALLIGLNLSVILSGKVFGYYLIVIFLLLLLFCYKQGKINFFQDNT